MDESAGFWPTSLLMSSGGCPTPVPERICMKPMLRFAPFSSWSITLHSGFALENFRLDAWLVRTAGSFGALGVSVWGRVVHCENIDR